MERMISVFAVALSGAIVVSAGAYAAGEGSLASGFREAAFVSPSLGPGTVDTQRDVIEPPSSIDPGMALDPPQTGAKMPIIRPQGTIPGGRLILPR